MSGAYTAFGVLGMPSADLASKQAIKAAGCTHTVIAVSWSTLQPNGPGTALDATAVSAVQADFDQAAQVGLKVLLELAIHYPPSWAYSGGTAVESFVDQQSNTWDAATASSGEQVVNWQWSALGRTYVADFIAKIAAALGSQRVAQTDGVKCGGGYYGETHYPPSKITSDPYSFWGYGACMQTGTGLASDQVVCPLPGYTLFSGTDAQDSEWIDWYINGLGTWVLWFIDQMRSVGWACDFHVCHPGYGVRSNQLHSQSAYRQSAAEGEDPARIIGSYAHDSQIWPYCTWLNTADGYDPAGADSDIAAWKKVYEEAYARNKHFKLWGENTGGENTAGLQAIFSGDPNGSALSSASYPMAPSQTFGFQGIFWFDYATLTGGGTDATMSDFAAAIAAHTPTL